MTNTTVATDVEIFASDIVKGDHIIWKGERREVTLVSRMSAQDVYFELGEYTDAIVRADDTITVEYPYGSLENLTMPAHIHVPTGTPFGTACKTCGQKTED